MNKTDVTFGAKQRESGCWIGYYVINGKTTWCNANIKKSERGALSVAMRAYESR